MSAPTSNLQVKIVSARQRLKHASPIKRVFSSPSRSLVKQVAATNIQRAFRGFRAKKNLAYKKAAAGDIQRVFRGYRARKSLQRRANRQSRASSRWKHMMIAASMQNEGRKTPHARTIQRVFRGYQVRKGLRPRPAWFSPIKNIAATRIQSAVRGHLARKSLPAKSPTKYASPTVNASLQISLTRKVPLKSETGSRKRRHTVTRKRPIFQAVFKKKTM